MNARRRILTVISLAALAAAPALAGAATAPPRPSKGAWKVRPQGFDLVEKGSFRITSDAKSVALLTIVPGTGANAACGGAGTSVKVPGKLKLAKATRAGTSIWIVGKNAPKTSDGIATVKVKVVVAGKTLDATLKMTFRGTVSGSGELEFEGCQLFFSARK